MTNAQTFSIVALAAIGIFGAIGAFIWGAPEQRVVAATMILGAMTSTITALFAAFKAIEAKDVAKDSIDKVQQLDVKVDGRLTALIAANERAFEAEKLVAREAGVKEGKSTLRPNDIPRDTLPT